MKIALIVLSLVTSLALNAEMLQGKVVRVADGNIIMILGEAKKKNGLLSKANPVTPYELRMMGVLSVLDAEFNSRKVAIPKKPKVR